MTVKKLCYLVVLTTIIFVQEELLTPIPSVQLTFFLVMIYGATLGIGYGSLIVVAHVLLDNLYMSSFGITTIGPMLIGYEITLIMGYLLRGKNEILNGIVNALCAVIYCALFIPVNIFVYDVEPLAYVIADIPFVLVLMTCNMFCALFLYKPIYKVLTNEFNKDKYVGNIFENENGLE